MRAKALALQLIEELESAAKAAGYALVPLFEKVKQPYCVFQVPFQMVTFDAYEFFASIEGAMKAAHEVGHVARDHWAVGNFIHERPRLEREAWEWARELFARLGIPWNETLVEEALADYLEKVNEMIRCECGGGGEEKFPHFFYCRRCDRMWGFRFDSTTERVQLGTLETEPVEATLAAA